MSRTVRKEDGTWVEGKSSPLLLREDLRKLPGELVTTHEIEHEDKIHPDDAPHIVGALTEEYIKKANGEGEEKPDPAKEVKKLKCAQPGEVVPLSQWEVDVVRMRVIASLINGALDTASRGKSPDLSVKHLWFEEDNVNNYQLRKGNPPAVQDRPRHMRRVAIEVDVFHPPKSIVDLLKKNGVDFEAIAKAWNETELQTWMEVPVVDKYRKIMKTA